MNATISAIYSLQQKCELKLILRLAGNLIRGYKKFKSLYITLQSLYPQYFSAKWDGIFFSLWSSELSNDLLSLCFNGCEQALWKRPGESDPFHHIYHLSDIGPMKINLAELDKMDIPKNEAINILTEILALNFLPNSFALYWVLLIELYNFHERPEIFIGRKDIIAGRHDLIKKLNEMINHFNEIGMKQIPKEYLVENFFEPQEKVARRIILPFYLSPEKRRKVLNFYRDVFTRNDCIGIKYRTSKKNIITIFGHEDFSWQLFFENPDDEDLIFKKDFNKLDVTLNEEKKKALCALLNQSQKEESLGITVKNGEKINETYYYLNIGEQHTLRSFFASLTSNRLHDYF